MRRVGGALCCEYRLLAVISYWQKKVMFTLLKSQ